MLLVNLGTPDTPEAAEAFLDAQCGRPLRESCHLAQGPLMALCLSTILAGCPDKQPTAPTDGGVAEAAPADIHPRARPGSEAPLGWTLAERSQTVLRAELGSAENRAQLDVVRRWYGD